MISIIMSICMVITELPMMVYAMDGTPEISLEEFTKQLQEMQASPLQTQNSAKQSLKKTMVFIFMK